MEMGRNFLRLCTATLSAAGAVTLTACTAPQPPASVVPPNRPGGLAKAVQPVVTPRSAQSSDLQDYYIRIQDDLLVQGLLRTDGGGPDTPFSPEDLVRNFENIAFFDEYTRGGGLRAGGASGGLNRWSQPVRISAEFGSSVPLDQRRRDQAAINEYASRLSRVTGHSITGVRSGGNFHVFVAGDDDNEQLLRRLNQLVPDISRVELGLFRHLPRSFYCMVVAVSSAQDPHNYSRAIALIRAEHPDLVRLSCIHEEIAQGLGLPNDSAAARPSIFNDDNEFALLTRHDELLLKLLYDPRLKQGMTADEARPIALAIAHELMGMEL
nr:DUF2927 domain-containing protein [Pontibaca salina]